MSENPENRLIQPRQSAYPLYGLMLVLLFETVWHVYLWLNDFNALSTDEYLRLYFSASWAKNPRLFIPGEFLSFYFYIFGTMIKLSGQIIWSARVLVLAFSLAYTIYTYRIATYLLRDGAAGLAATCLAVSSPLFMKISTVPLSETVSLAVILASLYYLLRWSDLKDLSLRSTTLLLVSQSLLFVANGLRYESWLVTGVCLVFIFYKAWKNGFGFARLLQTGLIASLPVWVPVLWLVMGKVYFQEAARFIPGASPSDVLRPADLFLYPKLFAQNFTLLAIASVPLALNLRGSLSDAKKVLFASLSAVFLVFLFYISLRYRERHVVLPQRTLLFFTSFLAPLAGMVLIKAIKRTPKMIPRFLAASVVVVTFFLAFSFVRFIKLPDHPSQDAKAVGLKIKKLGREGKIDFGEKVLVEKTGWDWCVIYVESNLIGRIVFDRRSVLGKRMTELPSEFLAMDKKELKNTVKEARIAYFIFKDPSLISKIKEDMPALNEEKLGTYSILSSAIR